MIGDERLSLVVIAGMFYHHCLNIRFIIRQWT